MNRDEVMKHNELPKMRIWMLPCS